MKIHTTHKAAAAKPPYDEHVLAQFESGDIAIACRVKTDIGDRYWTASGQEHDGLIEWCLVTRD